MPIDIRSAISTLTSLADASSVTPTPPLSVIEEAVLRLRDKIDTLHSAEYVQHVKVVPGLCALLDSKVSPSLQLDSQESRIRNKALELMLRLPHNESLRPYVPDILRTLISTITRDNEENGALGVSILVSQHKHMRTGQDDQAQLLILLALDVFSNMPAAISELVNEGLDSVSCSNHATFGPGIPLVSAARAAIEFLPSVDTIVSHNRKGELLAAAHNEGLCPSLYSFKVAQDLSIPVIHAFQHYPKLAAAHLDAMASLVLSFLRIVSVPELRSLAAGNIPSRAGAAPSPVADGADATAIAAKDRATTRAKRQIELLHAQVEVAVVWFTWMVKGGTKIDFMKANENTVGPIIIRLLGCIPPELSSLRRKILLVFYQCVQLPDIRGVYVRDINNLLDLRILLGVSSSSNFGGTGGGTSDAQLRTVAYRALADLLHSMRDTLSVEQISGVVDFFTPVIMDPGIPANTCAAVAIRLLLYLVEKLFHSGRPNASHARSVMSQICNVMVQKLGALRAYIPRVLAEERRLKADEERERAGFSLQIDRVSAASELFALQHVAAKSSAKSSVTPPGAISLPPVSFADSQLTQIDSFSSEAARSLFTGLTKSQPSPWFAEEYLDSCSTSSHVIDTPRNVRDIVSNIIQGMKSMLWSLCHFNRDATDNELRNSASSSQDLMVEPGGLPLTPGDPIDSNKPIGPDNVVLLEHVEGGMQDSGPNGLGLSAHGAFLSEGDLKTLKNFAHWSLDAMDLFMMSPSADSEGIMLIMEAYASVFNVLSDKDRNHLRELLSSVLPAIVERCFVHSHMLSVINFMINQPKSYIIVIQMLLSCMIRHVHLLNSDDEDAAPDWRLPGNSPPTLEEVLPLSKLPQQTSSKREKTKSGLISYGSNTIAIERIRVCGMRSRMVATGDWTFNEDGEFDHVLDPAALTADEHLAKQRETLPHAILSPSTSWTTTSGPLAPRITTNRRLRAAQTAHRAHMLLRIFKSMINNRSDGSSDQGQSSSQSSHESLLTLEPFIGPLVRSILRNLVLSVSPRFTYMPRPLLYILRMLLRRVSSDVMEHADRERRSGRSGSTINAVELSKLNDTVIRVHTEFASVVPSLIDTLMRLYAFSTEPNDRELMIEICLSIPVRLNSQVQYLHKFLGPIVLGLRAQDNKVLVPHALKLLDTFIDNFSSSYLASVFKLEPGVYADLMHEMSALLKPSPAPHGPEVLRLLGKLGGINRLHFLHLPQLQHVSPAATNGLFLKGTWRVADKVYTPPADISLHDQEKLEAVFTSSIQGNETVPVKNIEDPMSADFDLHSVQARSSMDDALSTASRAIQKLRELQGKGKAKIDNTPPVAGAVPDEEPLDVSLALDRIMHYASSMIVRHLEVLREDAVDRDEPGVHNASTPKLNRLRTVRKRSQPSQNIGSKVTDKYQLPLKRMTRSSETGEPVGITSSGSHRPLSVNEAATVAQNGRVRVYSRVYDSDSDSSGEEDTHEVGTITLTPLQSLLSAQRGILVSKRRAWHLIESCVPLVLHEMHAIMSQDVMNVSKTASHLFGENGECRTSSSFPSDSTSGPQASCSTPSEKFGFDGAHKLHPRAAAAASARRVQLTLLRCLAFACADLHLRPVAYPLLMGLVRQYTARAVALTPRPTPESLPECLLRRSEVGWRSLSYNVPVLRNHTHPPAGDNFSRDDFLEESTEESVASISSDSSQLGFDDPLLLNIFITSLACDEPPSSVGSEPFSTGIGMHVLRPVILNILDEMHATLCSLTPSRAQSSNNDIEMDSEASKSIFTEKAERAVAADSAVRSAMSSAVADEGRRLEAVCVSGRMLLGDLVLRLSTSAFRPTVRAKQSSCLVLIALLARVHPVLAQYYSFDLIRTGLFVLRTYLPEAAASTVLAGLHLLKDSLRSILQHRLPLSQRRHSMVPLESLPIHQDQQDRLRQIVRYAFEGLISQVAAAREGSAYLLGTIIRYFLTPISAASSAHIARGIFTLMEPWTKQSESNQRSLVQLFFRRSLRAVSPAAQIGFTFALSNLLHLAAQAYAWAPSDPPPSTSSPSTGSALPSRPEDAIWQASIASFTSSASIAQSAIKLEEALAITRQHDPNEIVLNPAYVAATAQMMAERSTENVIGLQSHGLGTSAGPITVAGSLSTLANPQISHVMNISSITNPPAETPMSPADLHVCLAAAQSFPYPMRWPPPIENPVRNPTNVAGNMCTVTSSSSAATYFRNNAFLSEYTDPFDPFQFEQVGDGRVYAHLHDLSFGDDEEVVDATDSIHYSAGSEKKDMFPAPPKYRFNLSQLSVPTWPEFLDKSSSLEGEERVEEMQRGKLLDQYSRTLFRPLTFPVLFRCGVLRMLEAIARTIPEVILEKSSARNGIPSPEDSGASNNDAAAASNNALRDSAFKIFFEVNPDSNPSKQHSEPVVDRYLPVVNAATGHSHLLLSATHDALNMFLAASKRGGGIAGMGQVGGDGGETGIYALDDSSSNRGGGLASHSSLDLRKFLRPLLDMFSYHLKFKFLNIDTLCSMLPTISIYLNTEFGKKLLTDLGSWVKVNHIRDALGNTSKEPDIAASVMNQFHLLYIDVPYTLPRIARLVCLLEAKLHQFRSRGPLTSPFRIPSARFFSRYPAESGAFFLGNNRLLNPAYANLFTICCTQGLASTGLLSWLSSPTGEDMWVSACFPDFATNTSGSTSSSSSRNYSLQELQLLHYRGLQIFTALQCDDDAWLPQRPHMLEIALKLWSSNDIRHRLISMTPPPGAPPNGLPHEAILPTDANTVKGGAFIPWTLPRSLWNAGYFIDIRLISDILVRVVRQAIKKARAISAALAFELIAPGASQCGSPAFIAASSIPAFDANTVCNVLVALCHSISVFARVSYSDVRYFFETEVATVPSFELRTAIFKTFLSSGSTSVRIDDAIRATGIRNIIIPVIRHVSALEEDISAIFLSAGPEAASRTYLAAGGSLEGSDALRGVISSQVLMASVTPSSSSVPAPGRARRASFSAGLFPETDISPLIAMPKSTSPEELLPQSQTSVSVAQTPSSRLSFPPIETISPQQMRISGSAFSGRALAAGLGGHSARSIVEGFMSPSGSYGGLGWTPKLPVRSTPTMSQSSVASQASVTSDQLRGDHNEKLSWSEAVYMYTPPHRGPSLVYHEVPNSVRNKIFGPRYPFMRLLGTAWISDFISMLVSFSSPSRSSTGTTPAVPITPSVNLPPKEYIQPTDELRVELVRLTEAIMEHVSVEIYTTGPDNHRRVLIVFIWHLLKASDIVVKQHAFVAMARYLQVYEAPPKTLLQVAHALFDLIRQNSETARLELWRRAFNMLLPTLSFRLPNDEWRGFVVRTLKKILFDELHNLPLVMILWNAVLDHSRIFYAFRAPLVSSIVSTAHKLIMQLSPPLAHKDLLIRLLSTVAVWQAQARLDILIAKANAQDSASSSSSLSTEGSAVRANLVARTNSRRGTTFMPVHYPTPQAGWGSRDSAVGSGSSNSTDTDDLAISEWVIGFTARAAILCSTDADSRHLTKRAVDVLATMIRLWPDASIQRSYIQRPPAQLQAYRSANFPSAQPRSAESIRLRDESEAAYLCATGEILLALLRSEGKARDFIPENSGAVMDYLVASCMSSDKSVLTILRRVMRKMLILYPLALPPHRMQHVRIYSCFASILALRLGPFAGLTKERTNEVVKSISDSFILPSSEVKNEAREKVQVLQFIAEGRIPAPGGGPQVHQVLPSAIAADAKALATEQAAAQAAGKPLPAPRVLQPQPALSGNDLARAQYIANRSWVDFTQDRALKLLAHDDIDDNEARDTWRMVSSIILSDRPPLPPSPAQDLELLFLVRILRDVSKFGYAFGSSFTNTLHSIMNRLVNFHIECEEISMRQLKNESSNISENDPHANAEVRRIQAQTLSIIIPMLATRNTFLSTSKQTYLSSIARLLANSSDAGVLRTCMQLLPTLFNSSPVPLHNISFGLTQVEKSRLLESVLIYLAILPNGSSQIHKDVLLRTQKLSPDLFTNLQTDLLHMLLRLYTGDDNIGKTAESAKKFMLAMFSRSGSSPPDSVFAAADAARVANAETKPNSYWFSALNRYIGPGIVAADADVSLRCFNLFVAHARVRRIFEMREEVLRVQQARLLSREKFLAQAKRRRIDGYPTVPIISYGVPDPFTSGALLPFKATVVESAAQTKSKAADAAAAAASAETPGTPTAGGPQQPQSAAGNSLLNEDKGVRFNFVHDDPNKAEPVTWHKNLDANTAASLEAAYSTAVGYTNVDARSRLCSFAGVASDLDTGRPSILTAFEDVLSCDFFTTITSFSSINFIARFLVQAIVPQKVEEVRRAEKISNSAMSQQSALMEIFCGSSYTNSAECVLKALDDMLPYSLDISQQVWIDLLPSAWASLSEEQRSRLTPHITSVLQRDSHNLQLHLQVGTQSQQLKRMFGVGVAEKDRDFGCSPTSISSEYSWGSTSGSTATSEAISGSSMIILGPIDDKNASSIYAPRFHHDLAGSSTVQLLLTGFSRCSPKIEIPTAVLSSIARSNVGSNLQDVSIGLLEKHLEEAISNARKYDDQLKNAREPLFSESLIISSSSAVRAPESLAESHSILSDAASLRDDLYLSEAIGNEIIDLSPQGATPDTSSRLSRVRTSAARVAKIREQLSQARHSVLEISHALGMVYSALRSEDLARGLKRRFASTTVTARLLDLEASGLWEELLDTSLRAIINVRDAADHFYREEEVVRNLQVRLLKKTIESETTAAAAAAAITDDVKMENQTSDSNSISTDSSMIIDDARGSLTTIDRLLCGDMTGLKRARPVYLGLSAADKKSLSADGLLLTDPERQYDSTAANFSGLMDVSKDKKLTSMTDVSYKRPSSANAGALRDQLNALIKASQDSSPEGELTSEQIHSKRLTFLKSFSSLDPIVPRGHIVDDINIALLRADSKVTGPTVPQTLIDPSNLSSSPLQPMQLLTLSSGLPQQPRYELPPIIEVQFWEEKWVEACKQLRQWKTLRIYAQVAGDAVLMGETLSRTANAQHLGDWTELRELQQSSPSFAFDASRNFATKLLNVEAAINFMDIRSAGKQLEDAQNYWLKEWQALPPLAVSPAHEHLLMQSQLLQEARDTLSLASNLDALTKQNTEHFTPPDIRPLIQLWRERLPNPWDSAHLWDGVFSWRMHLFTFLHREIRARVNAEDDNSSQQHDAPWSVIKLAHVARKLGLRNLSASQLDRLDSSKAGAHTAQDKFLITKESLLLHIPDRIADSICQHQLRRELYRREQTFASNRAEEIASLTPCAQLQPYTREQLASARLGLYTLGEFSVDAYSAHKDDFHRIENEKYRSELFCIGGQLREILGERYWPSALISYAAAATSNNSSSVPNAWLQWGQYLDRLYHHLRVETRIPHVVQADASVRDRKRSSNTSGTPSIESAPLAMTERNPLFVAAELAANGSRTTLRQPSTFGGDGSINIDNNDSNSSSAPVADLPNLVAAQAVSAYLKAVSSNCPLPCIQLARVLNLAGFEDGSQGNAIVNALKSGIGNLPTWVWTQWIPQLLAGLTRPESESCQNILLALAASYPQAIHYHVRVFVLEKKDAETAARAANPPKAAEAALARIACDRAYKVYMEMHHLHSVPTSIDGVVEEFVNRAAKMTIEEEFMNYFSIYYSRAVSFATSYLHGSHKLHTLIASNAPSNQVAEQQAKILLKEQDFISKQVIPGIHRFLVMKLVALQPGAGTPSFVSRVNRFINRYRNALFLDFCSALPVDVASSEGILVPQGAADVANPKAPQSIDTLLVRFRVWRARFLSLMVMRRMQSAVDAHVVNVADHNTNVLELQYTDIEIPGQYTSAPADQEPIPANHVRLACVDASMNIVITSGATNRRIVLIGDNGRRYPFLLQASSGGTLISSTSSRLSQAINVFNALFAKFPSTRSRKLVFSQQVVVPLTARLRMTAEQTSTMMFTDALDRYLEGTVSGKKGSKKGIPSCSDDLVELFRLRAQNHFPKNASTGASADDSLLNAYSDVCDVLPDTVLSTSLSSSMASPEALGALRARFRGQVALHSFLCVLFTIGERTPSHLGVSLSSGSLLSIDMRPTYNVGSSASSAGGLMDPFVTESVPFRLTRNMVNVITPQGIVGPVAASMISAPRALFNYYDLMLSYLSVFFRDDVAAFLFSKNGGAASSSQNSAGALDPSTAAVSGAAATALAAGVQDANLLQRRIISNVVKVLDRMYEMQTSAMGPAAAAIPPQWSPTGPADVLRSKIYNFITMALNDKKLAQSQLAWMPWM
jgi:hypothetical protein